MAYPSEILQFARDKIALRKQRAHLELAARKEEIYEVLPQLKEIEAELTYSALGIVKAVARWDTNPEELEKLKEKNLALQEKQAEILKMAGLPQDYLSPPFTCPVCKDEGFADGKRCHCFEEILKEESFKRLNAHSHLTLADFKNFDLSYYPQNKNGDGISPRTRMEGVFSFCRRYAEDFSPSSPNLLMYGQNGLGKTHLSLAIAKTATEKGFGVIYGSAPDLLGQIEKERFSRSENDAAQTLDLILSCDLLVLDDLGAEFSTGFTVSAVYQIINSRLNRRLPTIISTNYAHKELLSIYGERLVSRLIGSFETLAFFGQDIRQLKQLAKHRQS